MGFTVPFLNYKLKYNGVFFAGHTVATVTYCVMKMILNKVFTNGWANFRYQIVSSTDGEWS